MACNNSVFPKITNESGSGWFGGSPLFTLSAPAGLKQASLRTAEQLSVPQGPVTSWTKESVSLPIKSPLRGGSYRKAQGSIAQLTHGSTIPLSNFSDGDVESMANSVPPNQMAPLQQVQSIQDSVQRAGLTQREMQSLVDSVKMNGQMNQLQIRELIDQQLRQRRSMSIATPSGNSTRPQVIDQHPHIENGIQQLRQSPQASVSKTANNLAGANNVATAAVPSFQAQNIPTRVGSSEWIPSASGNINASKVITPLPNIGQSNLTLFSNIVDSVRVLSRSGLRNDEAKEIGKAFKENNYSLRIENGKATVEIGHNPTRTDSFFDTKNKPSASTSPTATTLTCTYPTGIVEVMSYVIESDGGVRVRISDTLRKNDLVNIKFRQDVNGGWVLDRPTDKIDIQLPSRNVSIALPAEAMPINIPARTTAYDFAIGVWIANFVNRSSVYKSSQSNIQSFSPIIPITPSLGDCYSNPAPGTGGCSDTECCINHDLVCTFPSFPIPAAGVFGYIYSNKKTILIAGFPCDIAQEVDLSDCCLAHDIGLWCATNASEKLGADSIVAGCIASAIVSALWNNSNGWCLLFMFWELPLIFTMAGIEIKLILTAVWPGGDLIGWGGSNSRSCLCGGDLPTYQCAGANVPSEDTQPSKCRDLCAELGAHENCVKCTWKCDYDRNGNYVGYSVDKGSPGETRCCCPGSAGTSDFNGKSCSQPDPAMISQCQKCDPYCTTCCKYSTVCNINPPSEAHPNEFPAKLGGIGAHVMDIVHAYAVVRGSAPGKPCCDPYLEKQRELDWHPCCGSDVNC